MSLDPPVPPPVRPPVQPPAEPPSADIAPAPELTEPAPPSAPDDGWERLSPLSPVLRGGVVVVGVIGWAFAQLADRVFRSIGARSIPGDGPNLEQALAHPLIAVGILAAFLVVVVGGAWLSWRFTRYRITAAHVELRKGWLFRQQRQVPMERVQAVEIRRPILAQVLGLAEVVVQSAGGADAHLRLSFLPLTRAMAVRETIQRDAARTDERPLGLDPTRGPAGSMDGTAAPGMPTPGARPGLPGLPGLPALPGDLLGLGADGGRPVLAVPNTRLLAATVLHSSVAWLLVGGSLWLGGGYLISRQLGSPAGFLASFPALLPVAFGLLVGRVKELLTHGNFRITDHGRALRVTHGLTDHRTTTIPLHRVQAIEMRQSIWWRPLGWWRVQVNVAGVHGDRDGVTNETVVLPVGTLDQALAVLTLLDSALGDDDLREAARGGGGEAGWVTSPASARWLDPFAWRRRGYAVTGHCVFIRSGVLDRRVVVVPHARIQSLSVRQGPWQRALDLASVHLVSTVGPIRPLIEHLRTRDAQGFLVEESRRSAAARRAAPRLDPPATIGAGSAPACTSSPPPVD